LQVFGEELTLVSIETVVSEDKFWNRFGTSRKIEKNQYASALVCEANISHSRPRILKD
jgi:hypothetical protein